MRSMKVLVREKTQLLLIAIVFSAVLYAYLSSAWVVLFIQGITHTFITGVSRFKTGIFITWIAFLLFVRVIFPNSQWSCEGRSLFRAWALSVILFLYAHIIFSHEFTLSFLETVTASCNGENSVHHFFHSHLFKGGIAYVVDLVGVGSVGRGDIGRPFAQLLPTHVLIAIAVLGLFVFVKISSGALWQVVHARRRAYSTVPSLYTLLKCYFDGGPFAGEAVGALLFCTFTLCDVRKCMLYIVSLALGFFLICSYAYSSEVFEYTKQVSRAFFFFLGIFFLFELPFPKSLGKGIVSLGICYILSIGFYWHYFAKYFLTKVKNPLVIVSDYAEKGVQAESIARQGGFTLYQKNFTGEFLIGSLYDYFNIPPGFWSLQVDGLTCSLNTSFIEEGEMIFKKAVSLHPHRGLIVESFEPECKDNVCSFRAAIKGCVNNEAQSAVASALRDETKEMGCFVFKRKIGDGVR